MKRGWVILMAVLLLSGCGAAARQSGFYDHNTMYQSWEHMKFSLWGYGQVQPADAQKSKTQNWWGIPVEGERR